MSIVITGATGKLGRHVIEVLLERNVPAAEIVAAGRSIEKIQDFADQGVRVTTMDYDDPSSVAATLAGASKVLLIASSEVGKDRAEQHRTVIEAAKAEGVALLAYTSNANADINATVLGQDHKATEAILADAGVPYALLRNGYYFENWTDQLQATLAVCAPGESGGKDILPQLAALAGDLGFAVRVVVDDDKPGQNDALYDLLEPLSEQLVILPSRKAVEGALVRGLKPAHLRTSLKSLVESYDFDIDVDAIDDDDLESTILKKKVLKMKGGLHKPWVESLKYAPPIGVDVLRTVCSTTTLGRVVLKDVD